MFKDGQCTATFKSRAAIFANGEIAGVDLAVPLKTPLKLASMLGRMREPASLTIIDNQAVIDDGRLRCAFPVIPPVPPAIARDEQLLQCVNSTWTAGLDDLQYLSGVFNVIARRQSDILLSVSDQDGNTVLKSVMEESDGNARLEFDVVVHQPAEPADAVAHRDARVKFRDMGKVIERLTGQRPTIAINSKAVIITEMTENSRHEYFIGRRDVTTP